MLELAAPDLAAQPRSRRAVKKNVSVRVRFAPKGGVLQTREGPVRYRKGDALLTGIQGEQWPVERARFLASYTPAPSVRAEENGLYAKLPRRVWALCIEEPFRVRICAGGDFLQGQAGDWLVQYGENEYGIVGKDIFEQTYDIECCNAENT